MEYPGKLILLKATHNFPEPPNNLVALSIRLFIQSILVPILQINDSNPIHNHFQLNRDKNFKPLRIEHKINSILYSLNRIRFMPLSMKLYTIKY